MIEISTSINFKLQKRGQPVNPFTGSAAVFSLRIPTGSAYNGPLIRVRRSTDNVEQDINAVATADSNNNRWIDTTALLTFIGSASGFVTTWYDQSGNGRNAVQTTAGNQPRIVNAGVLETQGGRPSLWFNGINNNIIYEPTTLLEINPQIINAVANMQAAGVNSIVSNDQPGQFGHGFGNAGSGGLPQIMFNNGWATGSTAWPLNSLQVVTALWSTANVELYLQGVRVINRGSGEDINALNAGDYLIIGSGQPTSLYNPAKFISEVVVVNANWINRPDAQINLERSQGTAFGITVA